MNYLNESQLLTEYAPVAIVVYDIEKGKFVEANLQAVKAFGVSKEEILTCGLEKFVHQVSLDSSSSKELILSQINRVSTDVSYLCEWNCLDISGKEMPCEIRLARLPVENGELIRISFTDITDRKNALEALNKLAESNVTDLGLFLQSCLHLLAKAYGAQFVLIGLLLDDNKNRIKTQAVLGNKEILENFEYDLLGTPCADVLGRHKVFISSNVINLYPDDKMLADMGVDSYFGTSLVSASGEKMGLVAVLDGKPMELTPWTAPVLATFCQRIALEIESHQAKKKLKLSEGELSTVLQDMRDTFCRTDSAGCIVRISSSIKQLLDYAPEKILGKKLAELFVESDGYEKLIREIKEHEGVVENHMAAIKHKDGAIIWALINAHYYDGDESGIEGTIRDVTSIKETEEQMKKLSMALEQSADVVIITDCTGTIEYVNRSFELTTGYSKDEVLGGKPNIVKSGKQKEEFYTNLWQTLIGGKVFSDVLINRRKDGSLYYEQKTITPLKDMQGNVTHFVSTGKDITERMYAQERLQYMAHHDPLTELPNRTLFLDRLKNALASAREHKRLVAVMFLDLDRFKTINDSLGHDVGDKLLKLIAQRLVGDVRDGDTVARLGGDEFAVLLDDIVSEKDISKLAKKILQALEPKFIVDDREFYISASIGVSIFPEDGEDSRVLLKNADIAMYRAKDLGKNNYQFYSTEMSEKAFERLTLESSLRRALELDEFVLHYQPQVDVDKKTVIGVEALIRWQHPDLGLVSPLEFIPLLEETGQIVSVGDWVLRSACKQSVLWREMFDNYPLRMSVNLSSLQFNDVDFVHRIKKIISDTGIDPKLLELEITESILMRNASSTIEAINALSEMGVRFAIDDFGTGYSSLSYLRRFPIDSLKIDRSFIRDVTIDQDAAAITAAIIVMGQSLKLDIVAEGVETEEQMNFLSSKHCQLIQGYFFCKPLPVGELTSWFKEAL